MGFSDPLFLLLLPLPLVIRWLLPAAKQGMAALYVPPAIAEILEPVHAQKALARSMLLLMLAFWAAIILALAGPGALHKLEILPVSGRDIMLVFDLSGSMDKRDFDLNGQRVSRLDATKSVAGDFVRGRRGDELGLVVFGDRAYVAEPLSHDVHSVARAIDQAVIGVSGKSTAISDGLGLAMKRLQESNAKSKVIILLSDGVDTTGTVDPAKAAAIAKIMGIRIYTIALGPDEVGTAPKGQDAVDAETLAAIAGESGAKMFRVKTTADLRQVAEEINRLEPGPSAAPPRLYWREYWTWPAMAALILALVLLLFERRSSL